MGDNKNGVIITVYVESAINNTKNNHHRIKLNKPKAKPLPKPSLRRGYDRRSQLLAYAQNLRNANQLNRSYLPQQWSRRTKSWLKSKKWRWSPSLGRVPLRFHGLCYVLKWRRKYKNRATDEQSEEDYLLGSERVVNLKKRKARKTSSSQFWKRLGSICIGLACVWQCNKGAEQNR